MWWKHSFWNCHTTLKHKVNVRMVTPEASRCQQKWCLKCLIFFFASCRKLRSDRNVLHPCSKKKTVTPGITLSFACFKKKKSFEPVHLIQSSVIKLSHMLIWIAYPCGSLSPRMFLFCWILMKKITLFSCFSPLKHEGMRLIRNP